MLDDPFGDNERMNRDEPQRGPTVIRLGWYFLFLIALVLIFHPVVIGQVKP